MKKAALLIFPMLVVCVACGNQGKERDYAQDENNYAEYEDDDDLDEPEEEPFFKENEEPEAYYVNEKKESSMNSKKSGFLSGTFGQKGPKTHEFRDARTNLVVQSTPYPADWQVISKPSYTFDQKIPEFLTQIQGPNNLKTFNTPVHFHVSYQNPQTAQMMRQYGYGGMTRNMIGNEQILKEEVYPRMEKTGFTFIRNRPMAEEEAFIKRKMQEKGFGQAYLEYSASEWKNNSGEKALAKVVKIAMYQQLMNSETMTIWFYTTDYVFVDEEHFEETMDELLKSVINTKENPQWEQYVHQLSQQRAQEARQRAEIAAQQHKNMMDARWAAFNAHQERMKGISAAQDANHAAFMNRNFGAGSSNSQQQFVNMINEQETVYNPLTGKNYQVDAGSTEYWMDSNGNYIKNDDLFYTPNGDINLNNRDWVKVGNGY